MMKSVWRNVQDRGSNTLEWSLLWCKGMEFLIVDVLAKKHSSLEKKVCKWSTSERWCRPVSETELKLKNLCIECTY